MTPDQKPTLEYGKEDPPQPTYPLFRALIFVFIAIVIAIAVLCIGMLIIDYFYPDMN